MYSRASIPSSGYNSLTRKANGNTRKSGLQSASRYWTAVDRSAGWIGWLFLIVLGAALAGYAFFGRGFAYLGVAPLYVGEITLGIGVVAAIQSRKLTASITLPLSRIIVLFIVWGALNTLPYISTYGVDAFRDAALWGYSLFALVMVSVLLAHPQRLRTLVLRYRVFALAFVMAAILLHTLSELDQISFTLPGSPSKLFSAKGGDLLVHLAGVTAFTILGFVKRKPLVLAIAGISVLVIMVSNRGGMVSFFLAITLLVILRPPRFSWMRAIYGISVIIITVILIDPNIQIDDRRSVSIEQVRKNIESLSLNARNSKLEGTKTWRISWWTDIIEYTFFGEHFFVGKGYGVNLANEDGYQVKKDESLRSPHSAHMTILGRSGVPGAFVWLGLISWWFFSMFRAARNARLRGHERWFGLFAFLLTYWTACIVNASFDVFLEGPMGGIWFWSLTGVGIAALELYRTQPDLLSDPQPLSALHYQTASQHP